MKLPIGSPDWLIAAFDDFEEKAANQLREAKDHAYAAGYFSALADFKELLNTEASIEEANRRQKYKEFVASGGRVS